jgi:hypothetical protein
MGYPAPEVWGGFYVWATRRRTTLAHAGDVGCIKTLIREGQKVGFGSLRNGNPGLLEILRLGDFREMLIFKSPAHTIAKRER